ncbi:MAG: inositol monophosphatase [Pirellulales bacterium]
MSDFLAICEQAARAGGAVLQEWAGKFSVREKGPADLVTEADLASQEAVKKVVLGAFPQHGFLGEEGGYVPVEDGGYRWVVDPLDGTTNYVHGVPQYAVSVALEQGDTLLAATVFDPCSQECFTAAAGQGAWLNGRKIVPSDVTAANRSLVAVSLPPTVQRSGAEIPALVESMMAAQAIRRMGSAALNLAYVACGRFDAAWAADTKAWDVAAGFLLIREAGGIITDLDGSRATLVRPRFLAASTAPLHEQWMSIVKVLA